MKVMTRGIRIVISIYKRGLKAVKIAQALEHWVTDYSAVLTAVLIVVFPFLFLQNAQTPFPI